MYNVLVKHLHARAVSMPQQPLIDLRHALGSHAGVLPRMEGITTNTETDRIHIIFAFDPSTASYRLQLPISLNLPPVIIGDCNPAKSIPTTPNIIQRGISQVFGWVDALFSISPTIINTLDSIEKELESVSSLTDQNQRSSLLSQYSQALSGMSLFKQMLLSFNFPNYQRKLFQLISQVEFQQESYDHAVQHAKHALILASNDEQRFQTLKTICNALYQQFQRESNPQIKENLYAEANQYLSEIPINSIAYCQLQQTLQQSFSSITDHIKNNQWQDAADLFNQLPTDVFTLNLFPHFHINYHQMKVVFAFACQLPTLSISVNNVNKLDGEVLYDLANQSIEKITALKHEYYTLQHASLNDNLVTYKTLPLPWSNEQVTLNQQNFANKVQEIIERYYLQPLNRSKKSTLKDGHIERSIHGAMHVSRATLWGLMMHHMFASMMPQYVDNALVLHQHTILG